MHLKKNMKQVTQTLHIYTQDIAKAGKLCPESRDAKYGNANSTTRGCQDGHLFGQPVDISTILSSHADCMCSYVRRLANTYWLMCDAM